MLLQRRDSGHGHPAMSAEYGSAEGCIPHLADLPIFILRLGGIHPRLLLLSVIHRQRLLDSRPADGGRRSGHPTNMQFNL